jgi:hypothetical protein
MTDDQWMAFLTTARLLQPSATPTAPVVGIKGRFISKLVDVLCDFWVKHQATLIPFLTHLAVAALNSLVAARTDIDAVNLPGPE